MTVTLDTIAPIVLYCLCPFAATKVPSLCVRGHRTIDAVGRTFQRQIYTEKCAHGTPDPTNFIACKCWYASHIDTNIMSKCVRLLVGGRRAVVRLGWGCVRCGTCKRYGCIELEQRCEQIAIDPRTPGATSSQIPFVHMCAARRTE